MYLSIWTRPDITQAVNYLSQFNNCYGEEHWTCAIRVLKYLKGTKLYGISFLRNLEDPLVGYCDADWGNDRVDRKSYSGYLFMNAGGPVSWRCKKQNCVALSSTESEYVSLSQACNEAIYLRNLLKELSNELQPVKLFCDNQGALFLASNNAFQARTKHIDIACHHIREHVGKGSIVLAHVCSEKMLADIFTKPLPSPRFQLLTSKLGVCPAQN
jgi:hypothetical protein